MAQGVNCSPCHSVKARVQTPDPRKVRQVCCPLVIPALLPNCGDFPNRWPPDVTGWLSSSESPERLKWTVSRIFLWSASDLNMNSLKL